MKNPLYILIFLITIVFSGCTKMDINPPMVISEEQPLLNDEGATVLYLGDFKRDAHATSGMVQIFEDNGVKKLKFTNFKTDSGPDLRVYLAENTNAKNFIQISNKVENGNLIYNLPAEVDLTKQKYVLIWCKLFKVNFGSAELMMK